MRAGDLNVRERWARGAGLDIPPDRRISGRAGSARAGEYSHHHHAHEEGEGELSQEAKVGEQPPDVELARHQGPVEVEVPQIDQAELREERAREARGAPRLAHGRERVVPVAGARRGRHGVGGSSSTRASQCGAVPSTDELDPVALVFAVYQKVSANTCLGQWNARPTRARCGGMRATRELLRAFDIVASSPCRTAARHGSHRHTSWWRASTFAAGGTERPRWNGAARAQRLRFRLASGCRR